MDDDDDDDDDDEVKETVGSSGAATAATATAATPANGSATIKVDDGTADEFDSGTDDNVAVAIGCSDGSDAIASGAVFESGRVAMTVSDRENRAGGGATNDGNACDDNNGDE